MSWRPSVTYSNGRFLTDEEVPTISLLDRGYLLGDSAFATLRSTRGKVFQWARHLDRLYAAIRWAGYSFSVSGSELTSLVDEVAARAGKLCEDATLRVTVSRGAGPPGARLQVQSEATLSIFARPTNGHPATLYSEGIDTGIVPFPRVPRACLPTEFKLGNYMNSLIALRAATSMGFVEGIQTSTQGFVSSGTMSNLFFVFGSELHTPATSSDCRPGVTREFLLDIAPSCGITPVERDISQEEIALADEAFFASTLLDLLPIRSIDGLGRYTPNKLTSELREALFRARSS